MFKIKSVGNINIKGIKIDNENVFSDTLMFTFAPHVAFEGNDKVIAVTNKISEEIKVNFDNCR